MAPDITWAYTLRPGTTPYVRSKLFGRRLDFTFLVDWYGTLLDVLNLREPVCTDSKGAGGDV